MHDPEWMSVSGILTGSGSVTVPAFLLCRSRWVTGRSKSVSTQQTMLMLGEAHHSDMAMPIQICTKSLQAASRLHSVIRAPCSRGGVRILGRCISTRLDGRGGSSRACRSVIQLKPWASAICYVYLLPAVYLCVAHMRPTPPKPCALVLALMYACV